MPIRAVIFDLDQTLLDRKASLAAFLKWQAEDMLELDLGNASDFISRFMELDDNGRVWKDKVYQQLVAEFGIKAWTTEELLSDYENYFCAYCVPRLGVNHAISKLAKNYRLGLISNGKTPFQEQNFLALGFMDLFDSVIVSEAVGMRKPAAEIFHLGCSELEVRPEEAVFVGDSPVADIRGAKEAGLKTVFVPTELSPICEDANVTCDDLSSLPDVIRNMEEQLSLLNEVQA